MEYWDNKSKLNEFEDNKDGYTSIAKGIATKEDADKLAREKEGTVIQDEEDEKKFAVIKKTEESVVNEDARSTVIDAFYPHGYSLTSEEINKDTGVRILTLTKGDEELKVQVMPTKELDEKVDYDTLRAQILIMINHNESEDKIVRVLSRTGYNRETILHVLNAMMRRPKKVGPLESKK